MTRLCDIVHDSYSKWSRVGDLIRPLTRLSISSSTLEGYPYRISSVKCEASIIGLYEETL